MIDEAADSSDDGVHVERDEPSDASDDDAIDERLLGLLRAAWNARDPVPSEMIEAATAIADLEQLDTELAELVEHEAPTGVRSGSGFVVRFRLGGAEIAVHTAAAGARVEGTVHDLDVTAVALRHPTGTIRGDVVPPEFTVDDVPRGSCRLEFTTPTGTVATDWFVVV